MKELIEQRSVTCVEESDLLNVLWIKVSDIINDVYLIYNS